MYRDILYVLDRGHGLQAPCGESGSDCGFSAGFAGLQVHDSRRRSYGNVGIPAGISKGCGKGGKPALWLSMLSIPRHFHGLLLIIVIDSVRTDTKVHGHNTEGLFVIVVREDKFPQWRFRSHLGE